MKRTRLIFLRADPQTPPGYLLLNEFGEPVGRGPQPLQPEATATPTTVVLVVPGIEAVARWLTLPGRNDLQARAAARLLLEDEQAVAEPIHVALGAIEPDGARLVVSAAEARMQAWLATARLHGLEPDIVVPDHLLLAAPLEAELVAAALDGQIVVRGERLAFSAEPTLVAVILGERAPHPVTDPEAVERLFAEGAARIPVNLLQGDFARADGARPDRRQWIRMAGLAAAVALSPLVLDAAQALRLTFAARSIEADTRAQAAAVLPGGQAINDPVGQVAARLDRLELAAGGGPAGLAAQLFRNVQGLDEAQVESLVVSPDGALRATISHANYSDIDQLSDGLRREGVALREEATRDEAGRVVSDVILGVRR
ncbi:type II secretion system protein GspL [Phenylobacterium sp. J426]|uniref:type II secretion system protein GspL n=1 Tax=Phenylobacterium sp. J426 TaxID=2898439 RepID=UPI00215156D2|nr:type II secretion system protein GspL [Phenylobacterium sp. J426]MCR5874061.1 type II secretion system protein GspL [Phenylobacterium sp. J426]